MPRGTRHTLTGDLRWDTRQRMHRLDLGDGAHWFVDLPAQSEHLAGQRVTVEGIRSGFNLLDAERVWTGDSPPPPRASWLARLRRWWTASDTGVPR